MLFFVIATGVSCTSCVNKKKELKPDEVLNGFKIQCDAFKTVSGRVRIYSHSKQRSENFSFPAEIAIDFSAGGNLRLAAEGPLGTTPALLVYKTGVLTFLDFERHEKESHTTEWNGIPVHWMPFLFVGCPADLDRQRALLWDGEVLKTEHNDGRLLNFETHWVSDALLPGIGKISSEKIEYAVNFSDFSAIEQKHLPRQIEIKSPQMYLRINWLERYFDKEIPKRVFDLPDL